MTAACKNFSIFENKVFAYDVLYGLANEAYMPIEETIEIFRRIYWSLGPLNLPVSDVVAFMKRLNHAVILSGPAAINPQDCLIRLSQGLASGALRGDELRSVLEQLPIVADVIAQELGVTRGALRELGAQGAISAQTVIRAFERASDSLAEDFGRTVPTLAQSLQVLHNHIAAPFKKRCIIKRLTALELQIS